MKLLGLSLLRTFRKSIALKYFQKNLRDENGVFDQVNALLIGFFSLSVDVFLFALKLQ